MKLTITFTEYPAYNSRLLRNLVKTALETGFRTVDIYEVSEKKIFDENSCNTVPIALEVTYKSHVTL